MTEQLSADDAEFLAFRQAVAEARSVFLTAHVGPDGDTLGSMLALKLALQKTYPHLTRIDAVIAGRMPDVYRFMPGLDVVMNVDTQPDLLDTYDLALAFDCGSVDRLGPSGQWFESAKISVNIDHHISNARFGKLNFVIPKASASAEVVADLLDLMGIPLDADIATNLYVGILTDTGGFKYSNTRPKVVRLAADLIEAGVNPEFVFKQIYDERPLAQARLYAASVLNAEFNVDKTLAWTSINRKMLAQYDALDEHIDGVVELLRQVDTVTVAAVFKEALDGSTKVSLRSDHHGISVSAIMERFGGGGHTMAAGCTIRKPLAEARAEVLPQLEAAIRSVQPTAGVC